MRRSPGEKIGEGGTSDIHARVPGQVVKLLKRGIPQRVALWEARMTRAVLAAGFPAPEVLDEVALDGRFGIVLPRLDGPTLLQLSRTGAMTSEQVGSILATLAISVHRTPPPPEIISLHDWMDSTAQLSGGMIPEHIATGVLTVIERLPPGDGLCHFDLLPGNVIMTAKGPRLIDWTTAVRAPAALDLAVCHVFFSELIPELVGDPERPRAYGAALQSEYARLAGMSSAALTAAMEPYLPIACTFALLSGALVPAQRERLIQRVEADLRSED